MGSRLRDRKDAREILEPIAREIIQKAGRSVGDTSWNPDAHIYLTLRAAECRRVLEAMGMFEPKPAFTPYLPHLARC